MAKSKKKKQSKLSRTHPKSETDVSSVVDATGHASFVWGPQIRQLLLTLMREPIALGLALLVLYRPWKDGITFPHFNIYFTAGILLLATGFMVSMLIRGYRLRHPIPVALFAGYLLVGFFSTIQSVEQDVSIRTLLLQTSYFFLFVIASNGIRTRLAIGIVLSALVATTLINTIWAIIHAEYVLPYVRETIRLKPSLLPDFFQGATRLTPELKNRLEMDRAFGTFLFPNAMGGFLALCIPYMLGEGLNSLRRFREALNAEKPVAGVENSSFATLLVGTLAAFGMAFYVFSINMFLVEETIGELSLVSGSLRTFLFFVFFPCAFGGTSAYIVHLKGGVAYGSILRTLVLFLSAVLLSYGLWLTFSRGAFLGLFVGLVAALFLVGSGMRNPKRMNPIARTWMQAALLCVVALLLMSPAVNARTLLDDGFVLPNTERDYRPVFESFDVQDLNVEGTEVEIDHIVSGRSLEFRMTYWQVGLLIARDHWLLGVGPGNFGTVYGYYRFLDAHTVRMAHNDYLQAFVDTGVFGFILFVGFWVYFVVWGGARVLRESDRSTRFVLAGMYGGVLAFLVHAFFDFHFMNPSLAMLIFLVAGLFYARDSLSQESIETANAQDSGRTSKSRWVAVAGIVVLLLANSAAFRQFLFDYDRTTGSGIAKLETIGEDLWTARDLAMIDLLLGPDVQTFYAGKLDASGEPVKPSYRYVSSFSHMVDSYDELSSLGPFRVPLEGGSEESKPTRDLREGEDIADDCIVFLVNPAAARDLVLDYSKSALPRLDELEAQYPCGTAIARLASQWTRALARTAPDKATQLLYSNQCLDWAKIGVERSPYDPESYILLSSALWERGKAEASMKQLDYYREGIESYRKSITLYPTEPNLIQAFGDAMMQVGNEFVRAGLTEEGEGYRQEALEAFRRANLLVRYNYDVLGLR